MAEEGISSGECYHPPQPKSMAETGRNNQIHMGDQVYSHLTGMDLSGTYPKGKHRYPGYRAAGGSLEGGGGGERYLD